MDKVEHGLRLKAAIAATPGCDRKVVAGWTNRDVRTVTNWTTGKTMPSDAERARLREAFPGYDDPGDPVEIAVRTSRLTEDRQYAVLGTYKRQLREQDEEDEGRRGA